MCVFKEVDFPYVLGTSMDHFANTQKIDIKQSFLNGGSKIYWAECHDFCNQKMRLSIMNNNIFKKAKSGKTEVIHF